MDNLKDIIHYFIYKKIDIPTYIYHINNSDISKHELNSFLKTVKETTLMDERMNALLILWFFKYNDFDFSYKTPYLTYMYEIISEINNIDPQVIKVDRSYIITKVDNFYFIINHNDEENNIFLPKELQNTCVYCYNCNDDMNLTDSILLPEFSFYALRID